MINNLIGGLFGKIVDNAEGILDKVICLLSRFRVGITISIIKTSLFLDFWF